MHNPSTPLSTLTLEQRRALYDQARRDALVLRRQAIADAATTIGVALQAAARRVRALWPGGSRTMPAPRAASYPR